MLVINQGKQNTKDDGKFDIIKEKGVFGKISEVKMHESFTDTLNLTIEIIENPTYAGRKVFDSVTFDPKSDFSWKYRALRKCVGVPYSETEGASIDIEKILLNKKVKMNLDVRTGTDGNEYQKITYIAKKLTDAPKVEAPVVEEVAEESSIDENVEW